MAYKTKPELEEGSYIAYTDEPDTVVDAGSGGGGEGGGQFEPYDLKIMFGPKEGSPAIDTPEDFNGVVKINGVGVTGFAIESSGGVNVAAATVSVKPLDFIYIDADVLDSHDYRKQTVNFPVGYIPSYYSGEISEDGIYAGSSHADIEANGTLLAVVVSKVIS